MTVFSVPTDINKSRILTLIKRISCVWFHVPIYKYLYINTRIKNFVLLLVAKLDGVRPVRHLLGFLKLAIFLW